MAGRQLAEERAAGKIGARIIVAEEKRGWEKPCGGGLPAKALRRYPFLRDAVEEHTLVRRAELLAPRGAKLSLELREPIAVYSRAVLNDLLLSRAEAAGCEILNERVLDFERHPGGGWNVRTERQTLTAQYVFVAAGARTALRQRFAEGFTRHDLMLTLGYYAPPADDVLRVQFYEDFEGYAWAFPRIGHLSLGICGKAAETGMAGLRARLNAFISRFGYSIAGAPVFSHVLPALSAQSWSQLQIVGPDWALLGDAAGLVDPVTGEGIYFAMRSGDLLAQVFAAGELESYARRIGQDFGRRLALGARLAPYFYHQDFLGAPTTSRLVGFAARSKTFEALLQDLLSGCQTYHRLARRLYRDMLPTLIESLWARLRESLADFGKTGMDAYDN
jgi:flavin-dependent dehydrogenase